MMIKKRSGQVEEFNKMKLENSIRWAGASEEISREISSKSFPRDGMSTSELRSQVLTELTTKDATVAQRYENTRTRKARIAPDIAKDMAQLHPDTLRSLNWQTGMPLRLKYAEQTQTVRAEALPNVELDGIRLHTETLQSLGASVEGKVAISRA